MSDLIEFLTARLDEDEQIAKEASRADGDSYTPTGEHWQWEDDETDEVLVLDPVLDEYVGDGMGVGLRSAEMYPSCVGPLPHLVISGAEEVRTMVGLHVARHDPARVLREVAAKRAIVKIHRPYVQDELDPNTKVTCAGCDTEHPEDWPCAHLKLIASIYSDHPNYRTEWAVSQS